MTGLKDNKAKMNILTRIERVSLGNFGDCKFLRDSVYELRIDKGKGYRVYFARKGEKVIFLLCGGDKKSQNADIQRAVKMAPAVAG
ncbi:MAG: type II toxin-antitoxin system RelE/ParE family toxin [Candidatus Tokpelaia sp.]|nr:MAG: type II toxin-antitoxin system RelE/ParE family toxin [Candidatus Tokpelaia sp.]KAA6205767.1 MAG: type II toxin-antitoxin system RelE/ParE family toxin [Candidatus Tokpelaia sp.]KAA6404538.1 type II toxin-antitoxin system RelE/ParE family toxin [Candidatus Tokpelaia sp.]